MSSTLTGVQAEELHKAIVEYLQANGQAKTVAALRSELSLAEPAFNDEVAERYAPLLPKKWTSSARLQKKILELETQNETLEAEIGEAMQTNAGHNQDPASWIPASPPRFSLQSHTGAVNCVAFHPRFSSVASGSDDCTIRVWDWEFGQLERTIKGHTQAVRDLDYCSSTGNVLLASCSSDLTIKLWDSTDGYKNNRTLHGHTHSVNAVRFTPCGDINRVGSLLVSASSDQTAKVWSVDTGHCVKTLQGHVDWVRSVCPSADGRFVISTGNDQTARLWNISATVPETALVLTGHTHGVNCCAMAPTSAYPHIALMAGRRAAIASSDSAGFAATGSRDKTIKLWDYQGKCLKTLNGHEDWVSAVEFHPGGKYLLSVADDKTLRCWDLSHNEQCIKVVEGTHQQFITCLRWAPGVLREGPGGDRGDAGMQIRCLVATGSMDMTVKLFTK